MDINRLELEEIRNRYRILVVKILFEHLPGFEIFKFDIASSTNCMCPGEMGKMSEVLTMPIIMKDEKKYAEVVDVLDQLEKCTEDIYSAAGLCAPDPVSCTDPTPVTGTTSRPDQPAAHVPPAASKSDPLRGVKVPCYSDQLTRVGFAGGKDLRAGCHSAKQRLNHIYPFCIVVWPTKRSFLKV